MKAIVSGYTKGILFALTFFFGVAFLLAFAVQYLGLSNIAIGITTQVLKVIAIFIGVIFVVRAVSRRAWLHGAVFGVLFTVFAFLILSVLDGGFSVVDGFLIDAAFAGVVGLVCAMLCRMKKG